MKTIKTIIMMLACVGLGIAASAFAVVLIRYWFPNIGTITSPSLKLYIDDSFYPNSTDIDWGACDPGATYYFDNMTVINTGTATLNVYVATQGLPVDWTLAWQGNNTVLNPGEKTGGWLNLTIPATATTWPDWGFHINGEET